MPTDVMTFDRADLGDSGGSKKEAKSTHAKPQESGWTRGEKTRPILHDSIYDRRELAEPARQEETSPRHIRSQIILLVRARKTLLYPLMIRIKQAMGRVQMESRVTIHLAMC